MDFNFSTSLILSILLLLPLTFFVFIFAKFKPKSKSKFKSPLPPKSYPIVGSFFTILRNKDRFVQWTSEIVTSAPNLTFLLHHGLSHRTIITASPENVRHILKTNFQNYEKGDFFKATLRDFLGDGIFNSDGHMWKFQRQIASHEFNTKSLRKFVETVVDSELSDRLIPMLEKAAEDETVLDLQDILQRFAFDNICKIAFEYDPSYLSPSLPEESFAAAFERAVRLSSERFNSFSPWMWKTKRRLNVGSERNLKSAVNEIRDFATQIVRQKKRELDHGSSLESVDLLSRFLSSGHSEENLVTDIVISFILAGRDTTSSALTWFFWLFSLLIHNSDPPVTQSCYTLNIFKHPEVEREIVKEIKEKTREASSASAYDEVREMMYTHASICESMRLYPPVPTDVKEALNDDVLPDGTVVKKGMRVTYHPYAMGRVVKLWGEDWAEFNPMRWLEAAADGGGRWSFVHRDPFTYPVFQAGPRICIGKEMAFLQMKRVVASVLRRFRVVPVEAAPEPEYITNLTAKMKGGLPVKIEMRNKNN